MKETWLWRSFENVAGAWLPRNKFQSPHGRNLVLHFEQLQTTVRYQLSILLLAAQWALNNSEKNIFNELFIVIGYLTVAITDKINCFINCKAVNAVMHQKAGTCITYCRHTQSHAGRKLNSCKDHKYNTRLVGWLVGMSHKIHIDSQWVLIWSKLQM